MSASVKKKADAINKKPSGIRRVVAFPFVDALKASTSAFAIHLAGNGRLAWATTQLLMT